MSSWGCADGDAHLLSLPAPWVWTERRCAEFVGPQQGLGELEWKHHGCHWELLSIARGLISLSSNASYYLKPLGTPEPGHHVIHRAEHLPIRGGTCGHGDDFGSTIADIARLFQPVQHRVNPSWGPRLVEGLRAGPSVPLLNACSLRWGGPHPGIWAGLRRWVGCSWAARLV